MGLSELWAWGRYSPVCPMVNTPLIVHHAVTAAAEVLEKVGRCMTRAEGKESGDGACPLLSYVGPRVLPPEYF